MFELRLSAFQGPLDLLLRLVEGASLDITTVSLVQVTDQYLSHLHRTPRADPAALVEFIVIGAKLLYLKSCALLPTATPVPPKAAQAQEAVGRELTQMLEEYRRFKGAAAALRQMEEQGQQAYPRQAPPPIALPPGLKGVTLETLVRIFQEALSRQPPQPEVPALEREPVTVAEKMAEIGASLERQGRLSFRAVVMACRSRTEVVAAFLAVLELIKAGRALAEQEEPFEDILLVATAGMEEPAIRS